ncbi:hypothetical protein, partial [Actinoplanes sp. GCM10030250]|uniref:hypothetical protein n=1 Tax=Actinoplanes sp. GCM10030250 TaxID=3273376 RepID=UPI00361DCF10
RGGGRGGGMGAVGVVALLLGGCGEARGDADGGAGGDGKAGEREQAREALDRYEEAVRAGGGGARFVPVGEITGQVGEWEGAGAGDRKRSLAAGRVVAGNDLPAAPEATGEVTWAGGDTVTLPLISATQAVDEMAMAGHPEDCPECEPLEAIAARLVTVPVETTRGRAEVPAWEYRLKGTAVRITRPAIARSASVKITPPSWDPYNAPGGLAIDSAATSTGSRGMTVSFTGSPGPGSEPCGADYTAEGVESAHAVVVIVETHPHAPGETCTDIGAHRTATVELKEPLGERAVLEVQQGLPVPVTIS